MWNKLPLLLVAILFWACSGENGDDQGELVAKVGSRRLYAKELHKVFGDNYQLTDVDVKIYLHNWVRESVVLNNADKILSEEERDFSEQLSDYENSLVRYTMESRYIDANVDTIITQEEIEDYYKKNGENFELKEHLVKVRILRMSTSFPEMAKRRSMINYEDSLGKQKFVNWCDSNDLTYVIHDEKYVSWESVKEQVPIKPYNDKYFLTSNSYREAWLEKDLWVIKITDFQLKDDRSPVEMVEREIKSILLNRRKLELVKEYEKKLYEQALKNGEIEAPL